MGDLKFISWNVNGLRAVVGKNFCDVFDSLDADFFCLQETKMQAGQLDLQFLGYQSYWNYADKKGYSGTAIYTRHTPLKVTYGIGIDEHDHEGRVITLEMEDFYLVNVYTPNSQSAEEKGQLPKRLPYRVRWEEAFRNYLLDLDKHKPVIVCGDMNVAHQDIDLKNPKTNHLNAGFTDQERHQMSLLIGGPSPLGEIGETAFTDTFRHFYPTATDLYSWWSYRMGARAKNVGWRIDYFLVSNRLKERLHSASIHQDILGSDHCPVEIILKGDA